MPKTIWKRLRWIRPKFPRSSCAPLVRPKQPKKPICAIFATSQLITARFRVLTCAYVSWEIGAISALATECPSLASCVHFWWIEPHGHGHEYATWGQFRGQTAPRMRSHRFGCILRADEVCPVNSSSVYLAECVHLAIEVAWEVLRVFTAFGCLICCLFLRSLVGRVVGWLFSFSTITTHTHTHTHTQMLFVANFTTALCGKPVVYRIPTYSSNFRLRCKYG